MAREETVFLIEHYAPGAGLEQLRQAAARVRTAGRRRVQLLQTTIVPGDEALLCLVAASSQALVRRVCEQAGVVPDRISVAVPDALLEPRRKGDPDGT